MVSSRLHGINRFGLSLLEQLKVHVLACEVDPLIDVLIYLLAYELEINEVFGYLH